MATPQIPNTDSMKVASHEVVAGNPTRVVLTGPPNPKAMILELSLPVLAALTGQMLRALSTLDRANLIVGLRTMLQELAGEAAVPVGSPASPSEPDPIGLGWLTQIAASIQSHGRGLGLSDQAVASLISVALRDEVVIVLADQELSRRIGDPSLASSRADLLGLTQQPPWTVPLGEGRSLDVDPDLQNRRVSIYASTDSDSKPVMAIPPATSYRLGVTLQVASSYVERHHGAIADVGPVPVPAPAPPAPPAPPTTTIVEDPRAR